MKVAATSQGRVCGYFLDAQLGDAPLETAQQKYGCTDAEAIHALSDQDFQEIFENRDGRGLYWHGDNNSLTVRPAQMPSVNSTTIIADNEDQFVLTGLPENAEVFVNNEPAGVVSGGVFSMVSDSPGTYQIRSTVWPYEDYHILVEAE